MIFYVCVQAFPSFYGVLLKRVAVPHIPLPPTTGECEDNSIVLPPPFTRDRGLMEDIKIIKIGPKAFSSMDNCTPTYMCVSREISVVSPGGQMIHTKIHI